MDTEAVAVAEAALAEHERRLADARRLASEASDAVTVRRAALEELVEAAILGQEVTSERVSQCHGAARDAESFAAFTAAVARRLEEPVAAARDVLADAQHQAWLPVFEQGVSARVAAAVAADRARQLGQFDSGTSPSEIPARRAAMAVGFDRARLDFDRGNDLIELAVENGVRTGERFPGDRPRWPSSEAAERRHWSKPLSVEELVDALG